MAHAGARDQDDRSVPWSRPAGPWVGPACARLANASRISRPIAALDPGRSQAADGSAGLVSMVPSGVVVLAPAQVLRISVTMLSTRRRDAITLPIRISSPLALTAGLYQGPRLDALTVSTSWTSAQATVLTRIMLRQGSPCSVTTRRLVSWQTTRKIKTATMTPPKAM